MYPVTMPRYALARPPQTPTELWWAVYGMWGIKIPTQRVCPHHRAPFEAFANAYFAIDPVSVWWASRGFGGKSFLLSVLALSEATWLGANISLLGGSGAQSLNVLCIRLMPKDFSLAGIAQMHFHCRYVNRLQGVHNRY